MASLYEELIQNSEGGIFLHELRARAKSDGGKLTDFGKDFMIICLKHEMPQNLIANFLDITPGAVSQWASKLNKYLNKKDK